MEKEVKIQSAVGVEVQYIMQQIREELDDHRDSINSNTDEIESSNEYIHQLMSQMDKINERIDAIALYLKKQDTHFSDENVFDIKPLTKKEKEIFSTIYELLQTQSEVSYKDIARKQVMALSVVPNYISALIEKGVPFIKQVKGRNVTISLKKTFCQQQAKQNIVGVNSKLTAWM